MASPPPRPHHLSPIQAPPSAWLDAGWRALQTAPAGVCAITGDAAAGAAAAREIARRCGGRIVEVRLAGAFDDADVVRAIGFALDAATPGDDAVVSQSIASLGEALLILQEAPAGIGELLQSLRALGGQARFLATSEAPLEPGESLALPAGAASPPLSPALLRGLPPAAGWLALLPAGLPLDPAPTLPPELMARGPGTALNAAAIQAIVDTLQPDPTAVARDLIALAAPLLQMAVGGSPPSLPGHAEILLLRFLTRHLSDPEAAVRAAAASARLLTAAGQPRIARTDIKLLRARLPALERHQEGLLGWAEGDLLLEQGEIEDALRVIHRARASLTGNDALEATLLRRTGDRLAARGKLQLAQDHYRQSRRADRAAGRRAGEAAAVRGAGDVAVAGGEVVSAETLYETAALEDVSPLERANQSLGRCALAIARGDLAAADGWLKEAERQRGDPLIAAAVHRRRGEIRLRRGQYTDAEAALRRAVYLYRRLGHRGAAARSQRLLGDAAAAAGRLGEAGALYQDALFAAGRAGDFLAAGDILRHMIALERSDGPRLRALREMLDEVQVLSGEHTRTRSF